jgi:cytochrome P450
VKCYWANNKLTSIFLSLISGKRACLGESLAKMELFLFFVTFMQKFIFKVPDGQAPPGIDDDNIGIVRSPKNYELCAISRH